eukprot:g15979.t1
MSDYDAKKPLPELNWRPKFPNMGEPNEVADQLGEINIAGGGFWKPWGELEPEASAEFKNPKIVRTVRQTPFLCPAIPPRGSIHADLSTSMICSPDPKGATPTAILFNQSKIHQQVLTTTKEGMFWGPSTRSAAQLATNLRLFHRTQAREECQGTYPRYHIVSIKTARQGWFLLIDPQWTNGVPDHVFAMEKKILGGSIDQVAPEYRRVVVQRRRTPELLHIGYDYRGDFQWLNQGFWHCGMISQIAHYPDYLPEDPTDEPTEDPTDEPTEDPTDDCTCASIVSPVRGVRRIDDRL